MSRKLLVVVLGAWMIAGTSISGCSPRPSDEELGKIETDSTQLPGGDEKYVLPEPHFPEDAPGSDPAEHP